MELQVKPYTMPDVIEFNFEELKTALTEKVQEYEIAIYSDSQIKTAKEDRATLNRLKKALNDERIRREKEYMVPFTEFKARINEIIEIIDKPILAIDTQVKAYETRQKEEKEAAVRAYMAEFHLPYGIDLTKAFNQKWLNASVSMATVKKDIDSLVIGIQSDLETLEGLSEYQDLAITLYAQCLDLRQTLNEVKRQKEVQEQQERIEAERKAQQAKQPEQKPEEVKPEAKQEEPKKGQWVDFSAYLTNETAKALKEFLKENEIPFRRIIA